MAKNWKRVAPMAAQKVAPKKRKKTTRRAINARRTPEQREQAAAKKLDEWLSKMDAAMSKVRHYQGELKKARRAQAAKDADDVFG